MPVKKAARPKKTARGKKVVGLTSALGPKATTMVVIVTIAAGIMIASRQQQARAKERMESARADVVLSAEPAAKKTAASNATPNAPADAPATAPAVTATGTAEAAVTKPVTVTGCLERTDEGFRLKETAGADAPKSRSWKSGFLKKSSATLDVVDPSRSLQLASHVGRRVSVTGTLTDRDLAAKSLRRVGSCSAN